MSTSDNDRELERFKAQLQIEIKRFEAELASKQAVWEETAIRGREAWLHGLKTKYAMFDAIVNFALVTIRSLILVNGGAIVGIVSFAGNLWSHDVGDAPKLVVAIVPALTWFVAGLILALLTAGFSYLSQVLFAELPDISGKRYGNSVRVAALLCAIFSLAAFIGGAYVSLTVFHGPSAT